MANENKLTYILVIVVGLLAVVAIIVSAVALVNGQSNVTVYTATSSAGGGSGSGHGQAAPKPLVPQPVPVPGPMGGAAPVISSGIISAGAARIFSLAIGHDYGSHEYFDSAGYLSGFGVGLIDEVCSEAEIDCRITWDLYTNCWDSKVGQHATGGKGLHGRWYDACVGWYVTIERSHVFQFSQPYLKKPPSNLYVIKGNSFDTSKESIMNSKIVFIDGWASDEKCLVRAMGVVMRPPAITYVATPTDAIKLLRDGTYDAMFTNMNALRAFQAQDKVDKVGTEFYCMINGNGIMSRKDNDVSVHWNRGFMKMKNSGRFKAYCTQANKEHAARGDLNCIDSF